VVPAQQKSAVLKLRFLCLLSVVPKAIFGIKTSIGADLKLKQFNKLHIFDMAN